MQNSNTRSTKYDSGSDTDSSQKRTTTIGCANPTEMKPTKLAATPTEPGGIDMKTAIVVAIGMLLVLSFVSARDDMSTRTHVSDDVTHQGPLLNGAVKIIDLGGPDNSVQSVPVMQPIAEVAPTTTEQWVVPTPESLGVEKYTFYEKNLPTDERDRNAENDNEQFPAVDEGRTLSSEELRQRDAQGSSVIYHPYSDERVDVVANGQNIPADKLLSMTIHAKDSLLGHPNNDFAIIVESP